MRIRLLTISHKVPAWIKEGYEEYAKRMPMHCRLELIEIPAEKRFDNANIKHITDKEGEKLLSAMKNNHHSIALDLRGIQWSTEELARELERHQQQGDNIDLFIGGPNGLSTVCLQKAKTKWSLSLLTFPHTLVRVIIAEQLYRATCILNNHPYHK